MAHAYIRCCRAHRKAELAMETPRQDLYANHVLCLQINVFDFFFINQ